MDVLLPCGRDALRLAVPDDAILYESRYPAPPSGGGRDAQTGTRGCGAVRGGDERAPCPRPPGRGAAAVLAAVRNPVGAPPLAEALRARRRGEVAVVVSDATRPVAYARFLPALLAEIESAGVRREEILLLVATGMHRPSTPAERAAFLGEAAGAYRVEDHRAGQESELLDLAAARGGPGARVRLNRRFLEAGFRLVTGLVEPHFMAGFSGGPKAVLPGLASLDSIERFHGARLLADPRATNGVLEGNPLQAEALSVARAAGVDFCLSLVQDAARRVVRAFAGELEASHCEACSFVRACACPRVAEPADVVLTSCGGAPLDATFYQCVKGLVSCLPAVRERGAVLALGDCSEGIGSPEYAALMGRYAGRWRAFLEDIRRPGAFTRDQWQLQVHARALAKLGEENLHFLTPGLSEARVRALSVNGRAVERGALARAAQELLDELLAGGRRLAVIPEGPYCAPA